MKKLKRFIGLIIWRLPFVKIPTDPGYFIAKWDWLDVWINPPDSLTPAPDRAEEN